MSFPEDYMFRFNVEEKRKNLDLIKHGILPPLDSPVQRPCDDDSMNRWSFVYRKGYWKALLDFQQFLESREDSLSSAYKYDGHKDESVISKKSNKKIRNILGAMLKEIDKVIKYGPDVSVYRKKDGTFEIRKEE